MMMHVFRRRRWCRMVSSLAALPLHAGGQGGGCCGLVPAGGWAPPKIPAAVRLGVTAAATGAIHRPAAPAALLGRRVSRRLTGRHAVGVVLAARAEHESEMQAVGVGACACTAASTCAPRRYRAPRAMLGTPPDPISHAHSPQEAQSRITPASQAIAHAGHTHKRT